MYRKLFLTSVVMMGFSVSAARAVEFPDDGYMQQNKTYDNAATYDNMGVYEGSVTALAEYEDVLYQITAGSYLPAGSEGGAVCPEGSFCPGLTDALYSDSEAQGLNSCASVGDGTFVSSEKGATSDTDCYKNCTVADTNFAHATSVSGLDYYGTGFDTCGVSACENGWHLKTLDLSDVIGTTPGITHAYADNEGIFVDSSTLGSAHYGITGDNVFAVDYGDVGMITGRGRCSSVSGTGIWNGAQSSDQITFQSSLINETGNNAAPYCYCQLNSYKSAGGTRKNIAAPWMFAHMYESGAECASSCAGQCARFMQGGFQDMLNFRAATFNSVAGGLGSCEANVISITWTDATPESVAANNAGTCEYSGDIRTPVTPVKKPGKRFKGWKFVKIEN